MWLAGLLEDKGKDITGKGQRVCEGIVGTARGDAAEWVQSQAKYRLSSLEAGFSPKHRKEPFPAAVAWLRVLS